MLYTVAKLSDHPRPPRDLANVYGYLLSPASPFLRSPTTRPSAEAPTTSKPPDDGASSSAAADHTYHVTEGAYQAFHRTLMETEWRVLCALSFDVRVALAHPLAVTYLQALSFLGRPAGGAARRELVARAVRTLNASLVSPQLLWATHQPCALATAAVYVAAREVGAKMPECGWWEVFDVDREELGFLVVAMRSLDGWIERGRKEWGWWGNGMITRETVREELARMGYGGSSAGGES